MNPPATPDRPGGAGEYRWVDSEAHFDEVLGELAEQPAVALDTEFHRERTYFPQLALLQLAWGDNVALIDPLAVDITRLAPVLTGPGVVVLHAADQDLEVLELSVGSVPAQMFDTQVAAGFLGLSSPSLQVLCERFVGVRLAKGERMTDWLARPLGDRQRQYAAADVEHLLTVRSLEVEQLEERGRLQWAHDEIEVRRARARAVRDPAEAWTRIKEVRQLKGQARSIAIEVAAWRERRAAEVDQPVRFVLPDMAVVTIAQRAPTTARQLRDLRGLDGRHTAPAAVEGLLAAVETGKSRTPEAGNEAPTPELDRDLRPAVTLVSAWVAQLGRDLEIDPGLLATRADVESFLRGDDDARLGSGWRADLVGGPIGDLVSGRAALAFEGKGRLVLEARPAT